MTTRRIAWLFLSLSLLLYGGMNRALYAAPLSQIVPVQGPFLQGELPNQYNAHYLGLESNVRDSMVALTLNYDPQNNPNLKGFVNFFVLDEDGLRRFQAGEDPKSLAIAGGSPLQFDRIGNKMSVAFRVSGRGHYTVVVYNNSLVPVTYTLVAEGGTLFDNANQTLSTAAETVPPTPTAIPVAANTPVAVANVEGSNPLGSASGQRLTGVLSSTIGRHYLAAAPSIRDGTILFNFHYDPLDRPELRGNVNFWVLDEAGLNAIIRGDKPANVNLATGFPAPFSPFPNDLQANFNASGKEPYTVVVYNQTEIPANYAMAIEGGTLYDRYGQTNEAKTAASGVTTETVSVLSTATPIPLPTAAPAVVLVADTETAAPVNQAIQLLPLGVAQLAGNFQAAYQHHYIALAPTLRDGTVVLSLAFDPSTSKSLRENLNFWVLTEEGLQQVINGAPPSAYDIATGAYQEFGPYKGKLYSTFNASGRGRYTVIVFSNSDTPARYLLTAEGGLLATENVDVALP